MKIKGSKNLKYEKIPWRGSYEGYDKYNPENCYLVSFNRTNGKLNLFFRNGSQATIRAVNVEGGREMNLIENKLNEFLEKSYQEILDNNF